MPQTDKVIEEVDQILQTDDPYKTKSNVNSIYAQLATANKEVDKLLSLINSRHPTHSNDLKPGKTDLQQNLIGKYNYYGKRYRFEEKQQQMRVPVPQMDRSCITENLHEKIEVEEDRYTVNEKKKKKHAQQDESMFMNQDVKFPSQNYYIYFDKPPIKTKPRKPLVKAEPKPAWFLEKKVQGLEKEVKRLKQKEAGKTGENFGSKQFRKTDGPIRIKNNMERMVESLWP